MKLPPRERNAATIFGPTRFSSDGFLGTDARSVEAIIAADQATVESIGTTCKAIASGLTTIFDCTEKSLGDPVELSPGILATHFEARGKVPSPFRGDGLFPKGEVAIEFSDSRKTAYLTRLGIAMIEKHGFFQGRGSRYRLDPKEAFLLGQPR